MTAEEILARLAELHSAVRAATFERQCTVSLYRRGVVGWTAVPPVRRAESDAINERQEWLNAATAHALTWCHDVTDCPICNTAEVPA